MAEQPAAAAEEDNPFSDEKRAAKEREFRQLAEMLKGVASSAEAEGAKDKSKELIVRFATDVDAYIEKISEAASNEEAMAFAKEGEAKKDKWMKMLNMLAEKEGGSGGGGKASGAQEEAALAQAEAQMEKMAAELRRIAQTGNASVTKGIGHVADQVALALAEFRAASTSQGKWAAFAKMEEARSHWLEGMSAMKANMEQGLVRARENEDQRQKNYEDEVSTLKQQAEAQQALQAMLDPNASAPQKGGRGAVEDGEEENQSAPEKRASYAPEGFAFDEDGNFIANPDPSSSSAPDPSNSCDV